MATNVRIQPQSYNKLREMAQKSGTTMPEVLAAAIDEHYRKWLLAALVADYARLRGDPKAWSDEAKERATWDRTLGDGLEGW